MGTNGTPQRLIVLLGMAALFVCSQAVPQAFGDDGIVIGVAFLVLTFVHLTGFIWLSGLREDVVILSTITGSMMTAGPYTSPRTDTPNTSHPEPSNSDYNPNETNDGKHHPSPDKMSDGPKDLDLFQIKSHESRKLFLFTTPKWVY